MISREILLQILQHQQTLSRQKHILLTLIPPQLLIESHKPSIILRPLLIIVSVSPSSLKLFPTLLNYLVRQLYSFLLTLLSKIIHPHNNLLRFFQFRLKVNSIVTQIIKNLQTNHKCNLLVKPLKGNHTLSQKLNLTSFHQLWVSL